MQTKEPKTAIDFDKYQVSAIPLEKAMTEGLSSEKPRAFIILGLEGSGTYMMRDALVEAGCVWLDYQDGSMQSPVTNFGKDAVIRFSFPHAGKWPEWNKLDYRCRKAGYEVCLVWIIREPNAQIQSVLRRDPERNLEALLEHQKVFFGQYNRGKGDGLGSMEDYGSDAPDWLVITYSAFVYSEGFRRWLFEERLQLPYPEDFEVLTDRNEQYYK